MRLRVRCMLSAATTLVAVVVAAVPQIAQATLVGGGETVINATISPGIAPEPAPCGPQTIGLVGSAQVVAIEMNGFNVPAFAGPVDIQGDAYPTCADITREINTAVTLSVNGTSGLTQNSVSCPSMSGSYERLGAAILAELNGNCTVNGQAEPAVGLVAVGAFRPTDPTQGEGVTSPITAATFTGGFILAP